MDENGKHLVSIEGLKAAFLYVIGVIAFILLGLGTWWTKHVYEKTEAVPSVGTMQKLDTHVTVEYPALAYRVTKIEGDVKTLEQLSQERKDDRERQFAVIEKQLESIDRRLEHMSRERDKGRN